MGLVLGGRPVSYGEIQEETVFHPRTLKRRMRVLRREGYIETTTTAARVIVRITKAKEFPQNPADLRAFEPARERGSTVCGRDR
jgi:DNA-binding Lrp family transcriptional regulator